MQSFVESQYQTCELETEVHGQIPQAVRVQWICSAVIKGIFVAFVLQGIMMFYFFPPLINFFLWNWVVSATRDVV